MWGDREGIMKDKFVREFKAIETILNSVIDRHKSNSFHNNRVKADLEDAKEILCEIQMEILK